VIGRTELVRLFEHEPDLLRHLDQREVAVARDRCVVDSLVMGPGEFRPPGARADQTDLGFLVLEGVLLRRVKFFGRRAIEILGPGDFVRPFRLEQEPATLPCELSWKVCETARLALLDRRFERDVARWPGVMPELLDRLAGRGRALTIQLAIAQLPRLDLRLLCLFWRLADRWGKVGPEGVSLTLRLSQGTLADLVSARRPSVNAALRDLRERGVLLAPRPGRWILVGEPPSAWSEQQTAELVGDLPAGVSGT
jgi:CRP/FNR family cyclic AMP-dependent transcriptional regulator